MVVGIGLKSPLRVSQFLAASTLHGLSCTGDCLMFVSPWLSLNLLDSDKWCLLRLTGVEGKLILVRFSFVGLSEDIVAAERLCKTLSVLQWNSMRVWLYLTENFGGAQSVFLFGFDKVKLSEPGTLIERLEALADEQSEGCWCGMETGIWYPGLQRSTSLAGVSAGDVANEAVLWAVKLTSDAFLGSGVERMESQSISSIWLISSLETESDVGFSLFWNSSSWPIKCRLGDIQERRCLTKS